MEHMDEIRSRLTLTLFLLDEEMKEKDDEVLYSSIQ